MNTGFKIPTIDIQAFNRSVTDWLQPLHNSFNQIGQLIRQVQTDWSPVLQSLRAVGQAIASIDWEEWWQSRRAEFLAAAKDGWFIQPEMSPNAVSLDEHGALPDGFEATFAAALTAELADIEERLVLSYPRRAHILREAFLLHREGRFIASVPLFLNSAEGVVYEATNLSPFSTPGNIPQVASWKKDLPLERLDALLADSLAVKHPLSDHEGDSRHAISHGRSVDYGTEISSLKAISFLGFAGWLFCPNEGPLAKAAQKAGWEHTSRGWRAPKPTKS